MQVSSRITPATWIVVAEPGKVQFLCNTGSGGEPSFRAFPGDRRQPGAGMSTHPPARKDFEQDRCDFAKSLARELDRGHRDGAYDRLILVAEPATLSEVMDAMQPDAANTVVAKVPKWRGSNGITGSGHGNVA